MELESDNKNICEWEEILVCVPTLQYYFLQKLASVCSTEKLLWYVSSWVLLQILMGILFNGICVDYEGGQSVLTGFFLKGT